MTSFGWGPEKAYSVSYQVLKIGENSKVVKIFSPQPSINVKSRVKKLGICRCCLLEGQFADINRTHFSFDEKEPYSSMVQFCFDLSLFQYKDEKGLYNAICDACVTRLQDCVRFKRQILKAEDVLKAKCVDVHQGTESHTEPDEDDKIKLEAGIEPYGSDEERGMDATSDLEDAIQTFEVAKSEDLKIEDSSDLDDSESLASVKRKTVRPQMKKELVEKKRSKTFMSKQNKTTKSVEKTTSHTKSKIVANKTDEYRLESSESDERTTIDLPLSISSIVPPPVNVYMNDHLMIRHNCSTLLENSTIFPFKWGSKNGFRCFYCERKVDRPSELKIHTFTSHNANKVNDEILKMCTSLNVLKVDVSELQCTLCQNSIQDLKSLRDHLKNVHKKTIYDCNDVILPFNLNFDYFFCTICNANFKNFPMLNAHMNSHFNNHICETCGCVFKNQRGLSRHQIRHEKGIFPCVDCGKLLKTASCLQRHLHYMHNPANKCSYCPAKFKYSYLKHLHLEKAHAVKLFRPSCEFCGKSFRNRSCLNEHIRRIHVREKQYKCDFCNESFYSKTDVAKHIVKHTGERKHICHVCKRAFARKKNLNQHLRIHNNDNKYFCAKCKMSFVQNVSLKRHLKKFHDD